MNEPSAAAAPDSGNPTPPRTFQEHAPGASKSAPPTLAELTADPEIAALLDFEPAPNKLTRVGGWNAAAQRAFIAQLAITGSKLHAAQAVGGRTPGGIARLMKDEDGAGLRAAHDAALALHARRNGEHIAQSVAAACKADPATQAPGQLMNEYGEWEDEHSLRARAEEAMDNVNMKLRRSRRLFLQDISDDPAKRAAFEILTELPVDWEKAAKSLPQDDEPWRKPNMHAPDMLLTAENGWFGAEFVHGPDKKAELLAEVNEWRAERGLPEVCWKDDPRCAGEDIPVDE